MEIKSKITVIELPELGGKGVLVNDTRIITATHCVELNWEGLAALNDNNTCLVKYNNLVFKSNIIYAEAISDLAVLGPCDYDEYSKDAELFEKFSSENNGIKISEEEFTPFQENIGYMIRSNGERIEIKHTMASTFANKHYYESTHKIVPGDSGSPIVNEKNELIGVMSNSNLDGDLYTGSFPIITSSLGKKLLEQLL